MFTRILAATERVTVCDVVVGAAARLARRYGAALRILHVPESAAPIDREFVRHFKTDQEIVYDDAYGQAVRESLERSCAGAIGSGLDVEIDVMPGFPWMMILKTARKRRSDLIVMGPHAGRAKEMGVMRVPGHVGSTVQEVIRHERCPVMLVNAQVSEARLVFKKILVGTDFSRSCECALMFAADLAGGKGATLAVFHMACGAGDALSALDEFCGKVPGDVACEKEVREGRSPRDEILKYAGEVGADLIVMGSHTKEKEGRWYVGSAVEGVSLHARCPVCVITDPRALQPFQRT